MKKVLIFGVLPLAIVGIGFYFYKKRIPSIDSIDFISSDSKVTIIVDGITKNITLGDCLAIRGYSICAVSKLDGSKKIELKAKDGAIINEFNS